LKEVRRLERFSQKKKKVSEDVGLGRNNSKFVRGCGIDEWKALTVRDIIVSNRNEGKKLTKSGGRL